MQHSVKKIGTDYETISAMRKDKKPFTANDFLQFAKDNSKKYSLIEFGSDFLVSTWYSGILISDYQDTLIESKEFIKQL